MATTGATPAEMRGGLGLDAGGTVIPPDPPTLTAELKAYGVTGFVYNKDTHVWDPVLGNGPKEFKDGPGRPKAPPDPYAPIMRSFFSAYFKIWGTLPPPGYVEGAAKSMNLYEFIEQERKKPAFRQTETYRNEAARLAAVRDQLLGYY